MDTQLFTVIIAAACIVAALVLFALLVGWRAHAPTSAFWAYAAESIARFWRFWGPRLTDKSFLGAVGGFTTVVISASFAPREAQIILHGLSVAAALLYTLWEHQPFETLEGPAPAPSVEIRGAVQIKAH